jgi:hypothetical protein
LRDDIAETFGDMEGYVRSIAKIVQNESLQFGCASALYGVTKYLHEFEINKFIFKHEEEKKRYKDQLTLAEERHDPKLYFDAIDKLDELENKSKIPLKIFLINFFDLPQSYEYPGTRLTGIYGIIYINIPKRLINTIMTNNDLWTEERKGAKHEQRRLAAHEIVHELFKCFDQDGSKGLMSNIEYYAEIFTEELLKLRECYVNGIPEKLSVHSI